MYNKIIQCVLTPMLNNYVKCINCFSQFVLHTDQSVIVRISLTGVRHLIKVKKNTVHSNVQNCNWSVKYLTQLFF